MLHLYLVLSFNSVIGVIHILRNHQRGGGGLRNDYANAIFALSNAKFDCGKGSEIYKNR